MGCLLNKVATVGDGVVKVGHCEGMCFTLNRLGPSYRSTMGITLESTTRPLHKQPDFCSPWHQQLQPLALALEQQQEQQVLLQASLLWLLLMWLWWALV